MRDGTDYDVIVVGLGVIGSAATYSLAARGQRVLGVEQFTPAHDLGSSHGATRIIRKAYFERPDYVPLLTRAYALWESISAAAGLPLFTRCGALMIGRPTARVVTGSLASAGEFGLPYEMLSAAELRSRFPQFEVPDEQVGVFESDAGFLLAEPSVLAFIELGLAAGADLWFESVVTDVSVLPDHVEVTVDDEVLTASRVVIAAGAWASRFAALSRYPLEVTRQTVHWFAPTVALTDFGPDRFPVYVWDVGDGSERAPLEIYGFPYIQGDSGVKVGLYHDVDSVSVNPDLVDRVVTDHDVSTIFSLVGPALPTMAGKHVDGTVCLFAAAPDDDFVLGFSPEHGSQVVLAVGFSGHGFKFAPVVGEIIADLVVDGETSHDIEFLSPARLARR